MKTLTPLIAACCLFLAGCVTLDFSDKSDYYVLSEMQSRWMIDQQREALLSEALRRNLLTEDNLDRIFKTEVWIGQTWQELLASRGRPTRTNRSVHEFGVFDQWVYGSEWPFYVYLENGIVTSWQSSR
jgi:hypothetical protein